jgi:hypothetical protein
LTDVFSADTAPWREDVTALLGDLSMQLTADSLKDLEVRERAGLAALESGLGDDVAQRSDPAAAQILYRLLGACRGVSAGLAGYARAADSVDWACWQEERF